MTEYDWLCSWGNNVLWKAIERTNTHVSMTLGTQRESCISSPEFLIFIIRDIEL